MTDSRGRGTIPTDSADELGGTAGAVPPDAAAAPDSIGGAVARGVSWVALGRIGSQVLQFAGGIILARLLTPTDYGIVASVMVIYGFTLLLFDLGIGQALVHLKNPTEQDFSTVFWLNAIGGVIFAALFAAAGPLLAAFFSQPDLAYIAPVVALSFTFSVAVVHRALLERRLEFKRLGMAEVVSTLAGVGSTVALAAMGVGAIALALGSVIQSAVRSAIVWRGVKWRPTSFITRTSLPALWRFSGGMLGFNLVNYWGRNTDNLLIGHSLGAGSLGLYNRAYTLMLLPVQQVSQVLGQVMFPALAAIRDDHDRMRTAYRRALRTINVVAVPLLVGMAATAPALVPLLWGPQWAETVPLLQILCIAGMPQCTFVSAGWLYQALGRTGVMFRMGLYSSAFTIFAISVGLYLDGTRGVALGLLANFWIIAPFVLSPPCRMIGLSPWRVIWDNVPTLLLAAFMGGAVWFLPAVIGAAREEAWLLPLQIVLGGALYVGGARVVQRSVLADLMNLRRGREP